MSAWWLAGALVPPGVYLAVGYDFVPAPADDGHGAGQGSVRLVPVTALDDQVREVVGDLPPEACRHFRLVGTLKTDGEKRICGFAADGYHSVCFLRPRTRAAPPTTYDRTGVSVMDKRMFDGGELACPQEAPFHTPAFLVTPPKA